MGQIAPKLFTVPRGEEVVENKSFKDRTRPALSPSFLDRTVAARRPETSRREHDWDNPGRSGKGWRQLVPPSPPDRVSGVKRHISPVPLAGVVSGQSTHEPGTELQGAIRNRVEQSQGHGKFRPVCRRSDPRGFRLLLCRPERSRGFRRDDPAKRPSSPHGPGAQWNRGRGERADLGKVRQPPQMGRREKPRHPTAKAKRNLRVKRSDP